MQDNFVRLENAHGTVETCRDDLLHGLSDRMSRFVAVALLMEDPRTLAGRSGIAMGRSRRKRVRATAPCQNGSPYRARYRSLRSAAAEKHGHFVEQLFASDDEAVLGKPLNCVAERADAARSDRDFVHGIRTRQRHPTPTNISTNSEPLIKTARRPHRRSRARARSCLCLAAR